MKRDLDLVRGILQWMEARPEGRNINWKIEIPGYTAEQIGFHVHLMEQAGLVFARDATFNEAHSPNAIPLSITWSGFEFLDAAKDDTLWAKAKAKVIAPAGGVAFTVLLEWLKAEAKQRLGLPP
ncbi:MAG: DUF2513 domain-containing protein [Polaromonas sp.]|uniref:DUF2513 domain-containing protein n=1 Tax=Polaromonas sp. TaxID=1869339 RepID=UPI002732945B|nr:DUF2513 domain-containing protein [Polaromonas sp.]MDP3795588.1 DUF2513 domain-containing protein [Polaromonas sp.]